MRILALAILMLLSSAASAADVLEMISEYKKGEYDKALISARALAAQGDEYGLYMLGIMHLGGKGVPPDTSAGLVFLKASAEKGNVRAQHDLGLIYGRGESGVARDSKEAIHWYSLAASQGEPESMYNIGVLYSQGMGVNLDHAEACLWFERAAVLGLAPAQFATGECYESGLGGLKDAEKSEHWYHLAEEQGYTAKNLLDEH